MSAFFPHCLGCGLRRFALTQRFPPTSPSLACWPGAGGGIGPGAATTTACFGHCSLAPAPVPCTWSMAELGQAPKRALLSQYLLPPSLGPAWMLWQRSGLLVSAVFGQGPLAVAVRRDPPNRLPYVIPLPSLYFTHWQLPSLLLPPASLREAKLCSVMVLCIPSKTVEQTLPH